MQQIFRIMVWFWLGLGVLTAPAFGEEIPARSPLGIDYMALTEGDAQLAVILLAGEEEFIINTTDNKTYQKLGVDRAWKSYSKNIFKQSVSNQMLQELEINTPKMLLSFAELRKEQYPLLQAIGGLAESENRLAESEEMLKRAQAIAGALGVKK